MGTNQDQSGQAARYQYDAVGNLIAVAAPTSNALVFALQPDHGPPGTEVSVIGNALPTTPGQQVLFGTATPAATLASTAEEIRFTVPAVAAGVHALTLDAPGSSLALGNFEVTTGLAPPTITSVSHSCAKYDAVVSVTGSGFGVRPNATRVEVGGRLARITAITESTLSFRAPQHTPGGPLRVTTQAGTVQSSTLLYLVSGTGDPCSGLAAGQEQQIDGAPANVVLTTTSPIAEFAFHAERDRWISVHFTSPDMTSVNTNLGVKATLFDPRGEKVPITNELAQRVDFQDLRGTRMSVHHLPLPVSGHYVLRLQLTGGTTRNLDFRVVNSPRAVKGSTSSYQAAAGQSIRVVYPAQAGDQLGVGLRAGNSTSDSMPSSFRAHTRDHYLLDLETGSSPNCNEGATCSLNLKPFDAAGEYSFIWLPQSYSSVAEATLWLTDDEREELAPNVLRPIDISRYGENARFPVDASVGGGFSVNLRDLVFSAGTTQLRVTVTAPDGSPISTKITPDAGSGIINATGGLITTFQLPMSGVYTLMLDPDNGGKITGNVQLDPGIQLAVDGSLVLVSGSGAGHATRFTIDGNAGHKLGMGLTNIQLTPNTNAYWLNVSAYLPSGALLNLGSSTTCNQMTSVHYGCEIDIGILPVSGRYVVVVQGSNGLTASSYGILVSSDIELALTENAQTFVIGRPGGNARLYFGGTPGVAQTLHIDTQVTNPEQRTVNYSVLRPDGAALVAPLYSAGNVAAGPATIRIGDFPLAGVYTLFVDPLNAVMAEASARISTGVLDNSPLPTLVDVVPGPWYWLPFTAAAGSHPSIGVSIQSISNRYDSMFIEVVDPLSRRLLDYNTTQPYAICSTYSQVYCDFDVVEAAVGGVYQAVVWPGTYSREDAQLTITPVFDLEHTGSDESFLLQPGQNGRLNFEAQSGSTVGLTLTRLASVNPSSMVSIYLIDPFGFRIYSGSMSSGVATYSVNMPLLPFSGTYGVVLDPSFGTPASLRAQLTAQ